MNRFMLKRLKCNCCLRREKAQNASAGVGKTFGKWRSQQLAELEDKQNALVADKMKKEENKHQLEMDLQRKLKALQTEYNRQVKQETQTFEVFANDIQAQIEEKQNQVDARKQELLKAQHDELHGKGMDTQTLDAYNKRIAELDAELTYIRKNRDVVAVYRNEKIELFDQEPAVRQNRKTRLRLRLCSRINSGSAVNAFNCNWQRHRVNWLSSRLL